MIPASGFVELDKSLHDRKSFDCGIKSLNTFLQQYAVRHRQAGISMTMVVPSQSNHAEVCAYYTLSHTEIKRESLPGSMAKKLPRYPVPVMLIAQLAVDKRLQGKGSGKVTLIRALQHCYSINLRLPSYAVVVDALNDSAERLYKQYGFQSLNTDEHVARLFMSMKTVAQLFTSAE